MREDLTQRRFIEETYRIISTEGREALSIRRLARDMHCNSANIYRYFKDLDGITEHMKQHAALIRPKFSCVLDSFEKNLNGLGIAKWSKPTGGYFISLDLLDGTAKSTYDLLLDAGIKITSAGASFPYGKDPRDRNLRIAPTYPSLDELKLASDMLCTCARIACIKKLLEK